MADSGLMLSMNLELLRKGNYKYIIGGRIRNELKVIRDWILDLPKEDGAVYETRKDNKDRLIVSYTDKRANKDKFNRERGVKRLQQTYESGKITKDKINRRGYNKFLTISDDVRVTINLGKVVEDAKWDGWKGYISLNVLTIFSPSLLILEPKKSISKVGRAEKRS